MYQIQASLRPRITVSGDWELFAGSVGMYASGLRATIGLHNGELQLSESLHLSVPKEREALAVRIADAIGTAELNAAVVEKHLLQLCDVLDGVLLQLEEEDRQASAKSEADDPGSSIFPVPEPEPWPETVDGTALLTELTQTFNHYAILPKGADKILATWVLHTYTEAASTISPIVLLSSPQEECGKSTVLKTLLYLCWHGLPAGNLTAAVTFRVIDQYAPTLLMDEADAFLPDKEDLRSILDSGHERHLAYVLRTVGDDYQPKRFSTWGPKVIACIGGVNRTIKSRCIEVPMKRMKEDETVAEFPKDGVAVFSDLRRKCKRWADDHLEALRESDPAIPDGFRGRRKDNWTPLFAIAQVVGGDWTEGLKQASADLAGGISQSEPTIGVRLLGDLKAFFETTRSVHVFTRSFMEYLHGLEDRPWSEWGRQEKPISPVQVSKILKPFGIVSKSVRIKEDTAKGYTYEECLDAFNRYLADDGESNKEKKDPYTPPMSVTPSQSLNNNELNDFQGITRENGVTGGKSNNSLRNNDCDGVTARKGDTGTKQTVEPENEVSDDPWIDEYDEEF